MVKIYSVLKIALFLFPEGSVFIGVNLEKPGRPPK